MTKKKSDDGEAASPSPFFRPAFRSVQAPEKKIRRSLTSVGGDVSLKGEREQARLLGEALQIMGADPSPRSSAQDSTRPHLHGFHTYAARMHPETAAKLIHFFAPEKSVILDPFCGSGTVALEAQLAGHKAIANDLNPIAVELCRIKTSELPLLPNGKTLLDEAKKVAELADKRREAKSPPSIRYPDSDRALFSPHVLLELDSLLLGIQTLAEEASRIHLKLILSSILIKLSQKKGDTSQETQKKRIAKAYAAQLFVKKTREFMHLHAECSAKLVLPRTPVLTFFGDACTLSKVRVKEVDVVISSPPYVATYDYLDHYEMRLRWLGMDTEALKKNEFGARRMYRYASARTAAQSWIDELTQFFTSLKRVLKPKAPIVLLLGDSAVGGTSLRANELAPLAAEKTGVRYLASASQTRPHFHGPTAQAFRAEPKREHVLLFETPQS